MIKARKLSSFRKTHRGLENRHIEMGKMDGFDYAFDYTKRQCGSKPPFYAGFSYAKWFESHVLRHMKRK